MRPTLEILNPGALATIQDGGRHGLRRIGVPRSGALEPGWLRLANALVGNPQLAPAVEFFAGGLSVRAHGAPLRLALAGRCSAEIVREGARQRVEAWRSLTLQPGEILRCVSLLADRVAYLAVGGIAVAQWQGSAATYAPAGLGGLDGRRLHSGARLPAAEAVGGELTLNGAPPVDRSPIRAVPGPQDDYFDAAGLALFFGTPYAVSQEADRMGMRLQGPPLAHRPEKGAEIVSDGTVPGAIQVPGNGQPIVLLADSQTAGGYPKIATVISADLPRLAVLASGQTVRFAAVSVAEAEAAARAREQALQRTIEGIAALRGHGEIDLAALYSANLVSGVVDGAWPERRKDGP